MVESLLEAGADTKIRDKRGELAESFVPPTDEETRKLFRKARAQIMTVSKDDIASDDDGEEGSGSGSDED
ncbi:ankyrin repeat protein [Lentinula edodes]|uniref:Ankyrin repeat protein n=1 Tax=Lentinula edodes TaxID=5353 RepID=A0A1Q3EHY6_LENED|nr:ankyrin repeat protein [Lentinula edodes]